MKSFKKLLSVGLMVSLILLIFQCETYDRFYRPDVPQKLCAVGIFDIDDTTIYDAVSNWPGYRDTLVFARYISFEKSFQFEFSEELSDSLRDLSFRISNDNEEMFIYHTQTNTKSLELILPESMKFESGKKYFLHASENETSDISAESTVPQMPPAISLLSLKKEIITLDEPYSMCHDHQVNTRRIAEIEFSFPNNNPKSYYAILLTGSVNDARVPWSHGWGSNLLNFAVLETNTNGFFYPIQGRKTVQMLCKQFTPISSGTYTKQFPVSAYFIDGSKIPGENCILKIITQWDYMHLIPSFIKCFRIRLMSIPEDLYLFEKSLYTYTKISDDPFSEPVNLKGNIKGGNGVFALCRSRELIVYTGQTGDYIDSYF